MASNTTSLVLVRASIPAGARQNDPLDVDVSLPRESHTTSLRGGRLLHCFLYDYDTRKNLSAFVNTMINAKSGGSNSEAAVRGHAIAKAEGPISAGLGEGDEETRLRAGRIWGGARRIPRPIYLALNEDKQKVSYSQGCAVRINETFRGVIPGVQGDVAEAKTKSSVQIVVPQQYRLNLPHFLRVVRLIPLNYKSGADQIAYARQQEEHLMDPARTVVAALRLEALGQNSIPILKHGLESEHPLVRFSSAEALAYLGSPACGEELAKLVRDQPALRAFCLTALASLDEAVCHVELRRLLEEPSTETRYGAYRALRSLDDRDEAVQGELLNDSFWLNKTAPQSPAVVHVTTQGKTRSHPVR